MEKNCIKSKRIFIIAFTSTNFSLKLYKKLKEKRYKVSMISTPCRLLEGCSRSLEVYENDIYYVIDEIVNNKILIQGIYEKILKGNIYIYEEINLDDIKIYKEYI